MAYTLHHIVNGKLTNCERLGKHEVEAFVSSVYGKWSNIRMENETTGEVRIFADNGENWVWVK